MFLILRTTPLDSIVKIQIIIIMKRIYLDNAAATPLDKKARKAMEPFFAEDFGNPSALHKEGVVAQKAVVEARQTVARVLHCHADEVYFTGNGTESNNLAIQGVVWVYRKENENSDKIPHIITSMVEHPSVLNVIKDLENRRMVSVTYLSVNDSGLIDPKELKDSLLDTTVLVSVVYANSEIGTIQPIRDIVKTVREFRRGKGTVYPYVHTDACQAVNYCNINVESLGIDLMTFNGSKIYGPKGVGILFVRRGVSIEPIVHGGGQERGLRSGTENVPGIVGLAIALEVTENLKENETKRLVVLRDHFICEILEKIPNATLNGDKVARLPNNVHITIPNIDSDVLVIELDARGIACSARSACKSKEEASFDIVQILNFANNIQAKRVDEDLSVVPIGQAGTLRFSLGRETCKKDIGVTILALLDIVGKYGQS